MFSTAAEPNHRHFEPAATLKMQQPANNKNSSSSSSNNNASPEVEILERVKRGNEYYSRKYIRGRFLGKGGFAHCYALKRASTGDVYAVKIIDKASLEKPKQRQKLLSEIKIHASVQHKHIVRFEHFFEDNKNVYILLELCSNKSLMELMKVHRRLSEAEAKYFLFQIVLGVKFLHEHNIIHRDLKLGNIFLNDNMEVKIGDFGLATQITFEGERKLTVCGTPNYIAPEILSGRGKGHSFEVDIWSLGVILYTLLIGKPPFETNDVHTTYTRIKTNTYTFPPEYPISENAKSLIRDLLNPVPENRPSLDEILRHPFMMNCNPNRAPSSLMAYAQHNAQKSAQAAENTENNVNNQHHPIPLRSKRHATPNTRTARPQADENEQAVAKHPVTTTTPAAPLTARGPLKPLDNQPNPQATTKQPTNFIKKNIASIKRVYGKIETPVTTTPPSLTTKEFVAPAEAQNIISVEDLPIRQTNPAIPSHRSTAGPTPEEIAANLLKTTPTPRTVAAPMANSTSPQQDAARLTKQGSANKIVENHKSDEYSDEEDNNNLTMMHQTLDMAAQRDAAAHQGSSAQPSDTNDISMANCKEQQPLQGPTVWVKRWADFSNKWGLAYRLNIGNIAGAHYNDSTKMVWCPATNKVAYMERRRTSSPGSSRLCPSTDERQTFQIEEYPESLKKKVTLIKYFHEHLTNEEQQDMKNGTLHPTYNSGSENVIPATDEEFVYVKRWLKTRHAIIFRLSNKTVQVCFFDNTEIILSSEARVVTYCNFNLSGSNCRKVYPLDSIMNNPEVAKRLQYTKDILFQLINHNQNQQQ